MEKINIAELLKDCPKGMELDCTIYDNVEFEGISDNKDWPIAISVEGYPEVLNPYGCISYRDYTKCVIYPKGKTTWDGFVPPCKFKDGDIVVAETYSGLQVFILQKAESDYEGYCYMGYDFILDEFFDAGEWVFDRLATEEEKQKLFDAIKSKGYKWNPETNTLDKLTESNEDVDDEILMSGIYFDRKYYADEVELHLDNYEIEIRDGRTYAVFKNQKTKTFEQPKFKVGDKIKQIGSDRHYIIKNIEFDRYILNNNQFIRFTDEHIYELAQNKLVEPKFNVGDEIKYKYPTADTSTLTIIKVECDKNRYVVCDKPNNFCFLSFFAQDNFNFISKTKFDITTLVPFESKVLVRDHNCYEWEGEIFTRYANSFNNSNFVTLGGELWKQCIPYEGNEHLLGTTDDCEEYFKTW